MIPFNKQNLFGSELKYIQDAYDQGKLSGDGKYTKLCSTFMEEKFGGERVLLTPSCTHALELAALLIDIKPGDEVIMPSYTFVSTANAFVLRGARPIFCDIRPDTLNIDEEKIEDLITERTKAIVPVHYAGVACDMDRIMKIAHNHDLYVIEDAAQGVNAGYKGKYLGTIGHFGCYSFHETKNYSMGEGGALIINDKRFVERAEIIREKGTDRSKFYRGEIDKYSWVDIGSSYLPSEISAAVLWAQFEHLDEIQERRMRIWNAYYSGLYPYEGANKIRLPIIPNSAEHNAHLFYVLLNSEPARDKMLSLLKEKGIFAVFHYLPLHTSPFGLSLGYKEGDLPITEEISRKLIRLPIYTSIHISEVNKIIDYFANY
ncbi:dTDP-4-amino-4,6-dideoxygalactose transaminase [Methanospirillum sp. J.3.6.1-F.2.7.3]|uniref:dTDP-4-amino-4,6-dideoxygalactose transaminase n=1 Tax=Methanospirillum purgamenti TaxID=2834276 RepID=A0A8E7B2E4_9EURY|nr:MULTISPECIES: dTDP-4-amino-4,6-dideoxygalactose transaminase [Methanospirillum]MDX8549480.1 dTDP-4-amino-4,6-dideoxygalactose transaminase [Methanospirillum hungatei]QVV89238.1 dTDP-4-amino-4,6-dideoxygalactose transaminase [Methanospirillum sp. J.3.6.1-F.2.7.3]